MVEAAVGEQLAQDRSERGQCVALGLRHARQVGTDRVVGTTHVAVVLGDGSVAAVGTSTITLRS